MLILQILLGALLMVFLSCAAMLFQGLDRIGHARMQRRIGPPLSQGFWDFLKLLGKENITPRTAVSWLFNAAPMVSVAAVMMAFLYVPMGSSAIFSGRGDMITMIYLITLSSAALVMGAFASGSPLANTGAQREMVLMMSFEVPLALILSSVAWLNLKVGPAGAAAFSLDSYSAASVWSLTGWSGDIGLVCMLFAALLIVPAESGTGLMDIAEAKTEILEGLTIEYSGVNLALIHLAVTLRSLAISALVVAIFFPFSLSAMLWLPKVVGAPLDFVWFWVKVFAVALFGVTYLRSIFGRLKIWQAAGFYWAKVGLLAFAGMVLITIDVLMRTR